MRLDRRVSLATGLTRSQSQRAIRAGAVTVDESPRTDPAHHVASDARIALHGEELATAMPRYYMLNKPAGYVCVTRDRRHRTVLDLLPVANKRGLHVAGRLDIDATGLVLISDDGVWTHRIIAPRHKLAKTYRVTLDAPLGEDAAAVLRAGVPLRGERRRCAPALCEELPDGFWRVSITEGKYHQIKRMFAAVGNHVLSLHRERIGVVALDPSLAAGAFRPLTADEIESFRRAD
jgi:16S rRNA pseudouridine516 synthase